MYYPTTRPNTSRISLPSRSEVLYACVAVALATALTSWVESRMPNTPFGLFYAAVVVCGRYAGRRSGLLAIGLSAAVFIGLFSPKELALLAVSSNALQIYLFLIVAVVLNGLIAVPPQTPETRRLAHRLHITSRDFYDYMRRLKTAPMTPDEIADRILNRLASESAGGTPDYVLYSLTKLPLRLDEQERVSSIIMERGRRFLGGRVAL
jgi:K+-sensing histidine kinase KdpD